MKQSWKKSEGIYKEGRGTRTIDAAACVHLLHLIQIIGASVVNVVAEGSSKHGKGFKVCVVFLQSSCLKENRHIYFRSYKHTLSLQLRSLFCWELPFTAMEVMTCPARFCGKQLEYSTVVFPLLFWASAPTPRPWIFTLCGASLFHTGMVAGSRSALGQVGWV